MRSPLEGPAAVPGVDDDPLFSSRITYAVLGAVMGSGYGLCYLMETDGKSDPYPPLMVPGIMLVAGALVGLELHATRSWGRKGPFHNLARWIFAFVSAGATIGFVFRLTGEMTGAEYLVLLGLSAFVGFGFGFRMLKEEWAEKATPDQKFNLRLVLVTLLCVVVSFAYVVWTRG